MGPSQSPPRHERRAKRRFPMELPIQVSVGPLAPRVTGITRDISAGGVFFLVDAQFGMPQTVEFSFTLPPEITLTESITVQCVGKVVRAQAGEPGQTCLGATIERFTFVHTQGAASRQS